MNDQIIKLSEFPSRPLLFIKTELVWYALFVIQVLLVLRLILKIFGANPTEVFANVIYSITNYFLYPLTLTYGPNTSSGNFFEWTTLLAIIAYWVLAVAVDKLIKFVQTPRSRIEQARALSRKKYSH